MIDHTRGRRTAVLRCDARETRDVEAADVLGNGQCTSDTVQPLSRFALITLSFQG